MQDTTTTPTDEQWRPVVGYDGVYEVSDLGRVRSLTRTVPGRYGKRRNAPGRVLKPVIDCVSGYIRYTISAPGNRRTLRGHVIVAAAFFGPRPAGMDIRHLDGDRTNNRRANLAYGTRTENYNDTVLHGRRKRSSPAKKRNSPTKKRNSPDHCGRKHRLIELNLMACEWRRGYRKCLACGRARTYCRHRPWLDLQVVSDQYYAEILKGQVAA